MKRIRVITPDGIDAALDATGSDELRASMELAKNKARIQTLVAGEPVQKLGIQPIFGT
ncbi:hypothetical protein [Bacillus sp. J14TS2]|uniref:hypothetical protein n=1 Tax=Bacillus sp. J14TS2 TaxID=2807188 RepID=UPI001BB3500C|nr:hypothetical protein [Bacillus sp. J14TS2]